MKKRGLGKGLDALFSSDEVMEPQEEYMPVSENPSSEESKEVVQTVDIYTVEPDREQPRKNFDPEKLQELSDSIRQYGVLQPLLVQKEKDYYKIIAGERRWRAARLAGLTEIPVIVKEFTPQDSMAVSLIENLQRQNLNPMEESMAYQKLLTEFSMTQEQVAEKLGKSRSAIANSLRLQNLPEAVQKSISEGMISMGHAKVLLGLEDPAEQARLAVRIIGEKLTVRELEQILAEKKPMKAKKKSEKKETAKDLATRMAEERMKELLGTQVNIKKGAKKGKIEIEYHSEEELDLYSKLPGSAEIGGGFVMNQFFLDNIAIFMILILILLIVGIMMMSSIMQKQQLLMKKYKALTKGRKAGSLEGIIQECIESVSKMEEEYKQLSTYVTRSVEKRIGAALYKTKMVRYDAFEGLGGELSFIWVLLDTKNNGYLLHNIYSREGTSCLYTRIIENGKSQNRLAPEEQKVLDELVNEE